ncbi:hypothetical protein ANN_22008, partial [Periplaneta americana]
MSPGSSTESYPAFARIGLRANPGKTSTRFLGVKDRRFSDSTLRNIEKLLSTSTDVIGAYLKQ